MGTWQLRCLHMQQAAAYVDSKQEFKRFLNIARGSLYELVTCIEIAADLTYINSNAKAEQRYLVHSLMRKITNLTRSLNAAKHKQARSAIRSS
ncbi:MAG: four helix bundle protein [Candidatus Melainabacteria bacterium]|nr:four helix bundle protein [Candidatus Melainabacteria bacterium]